MPRICYNKTRKNANVKSSINSFSTEGLIGFLLLVTDLNSFTFPQVPKITKNSLRLLLYRQAMSKFWGSHKKQQQKLQGLPHPQDVLRTSKIKNNDDSSYAEAFTATILSLLIDKSDDELQKLLSDNDAYHQFLLSLDQVKIQNNIRDELCKETLQLAKKNLDKEPRIMELSNQCRIIRTADLAVAQEKLNELERQKEELLTSCSPASFLQKLQEAMSKTKEESKTLHRQLLSTDIDVVAFVQQYRKLRSTYQRLALIHLAAKTSLNG